ncbi:SulP family inorganic anion transporter [Nocardioides sp.]|uniref:SulP family inorganic anion transporter n=1 Tax=Nocardioides sp. TaxID=35761 RepID=UPI00378527C1
MTSPRSATASVRRALRSLAPEKGTLKADLVAGVPGAISSVPDGMASGVLAGVNPVHGLYASIFGPVGGGLTASTRLMVITTTSASALAAGSALASVPAQERPQSLFLLTVLAGAVMVAAGLLRFGRYTRFVPHSVMIGFLTGVAANIVLGQLGDLTGADVSGPFALAKAWDLVTHPGLIEPASLAAGLLALAILFGLARTRLSAWSSLIALVVPTLLALALRATSIETVDDVGPIPTGLPTPYLPRLSDLSLDLVTGALAVAALVLIQGAGVSESAPNPDGRRSDANRDFLAQGVGNVLSGLFRGQPVGGSVGQTAISVSAGARGRWAAVAAGVWLALILVAFSGIVGQVLMPTLAAVLIAAAIGSLRTGAFRAILRTGRVSQVACITTLVATLLLPVAAAVGLGVALSLMMQLNQEALDLRLVVLVPDEAGRFEEHEAPAELTPRTVTMIDVYGSLYYAGARTLQARLPDPSDADRAAVVLRLRGRAMLGATAYVVLSDYARRLDEVGGRLYLSGVAPEVLEQLHRNATVEQAGDVRVFPATSRLGESSLDAYRAAQEWLARER